METLKSKYKESMFIVVKTYETNKRVQMAVRMSVVSWTAED